ncbi:MAG TPA: DUF5335 family protein [Burkholderiales bacterium]|nr:DUF5335 family protein [Burkholderiales bacterium]
MQRSQWQPLVDRVCAALNAQHIDVEIVGPALGSRPQARRAVLTGLSYDASRDVLALIAADLEHSISHPRAINVDDSVDALRSLQVFDSTGEYHLVTLVDPLPLRPRA